MDLQGNCMLSPKYPTIPNKDNYTDKEVII